MNKFFLVFLISLFSSSCISETILSNTNQYTGQEIERKFEKMQNFVMEYEVENGGPVYDEYVKIYKIKKNECVIVSIINGDSGVFGNEYVSYFYKGKFKFGYIRTFSYVFLDNDETKRTNKIEYIDFIKNLETETTLRHDFNRYLKKMSKKTLSNC